MKRIFLYFFFLFNIAFGLNFSVAPTGFELDLKKSTTNEVYLINNTSQPLRIEVFTETPESYEDSNFEDRITIFPKVFSIKPGSKQTIRFKIKTDKDMKDGEYKSLLVFREKKNEIKYDDKTKEKNLSSNISLITEIAIGVTGNLGEKKIDVEVLEEDIRYSKNNLFINTKVISKGNTSEKLYYTLENEKGEEIESGRYGTSLKNGEKNIKFDTKLEKRYKKLILILKNKENKIFFKKILT